MHARTLASISAFTIAVAILAIAPIGGQSPWSAPKTPWGDPFARPWTAALSLRTSATPDVFEYACHEGNYAMRNILSAARAAERK